MAVVRSGAPGGGQVWHWPDLSPQERGRRWGQLHCRMPAQIVAGDSVDAEFVFCAGAEGVAEGTSLRIAWRWPFDWAQPERVEIDCATADIEYAFEPQGDLNPWHHHIELRVISGQLRAGEEVTLRLFSWGAPTFITRDARFLPLVSGVDERSWNRLADPVPYEIVSGPAERLIVLCDGEVGVGEVANMRVYGEDKWGNPTCLEVDPMLEGAAELVDVERGARFPVYLFRVRLNGQGVYRLRARSGQLRGEGNPLRVVPAECTERLYWGDLHAGQTEIGCGAGSLEDHFAYAREVAGLQFASQQANDHYIDTATWQHIRAVSHAVDEPGRFVCYLGCEWSPFSEDGGDRNVFYLADEGRLRRSDRFFLEEPSDPTPDLPRAPEFLSVMKEEQVLLGLHVGGRPTNLDFYEPSIEPLFEIHSTHGTSEWFVLDALRRGYRVGVTGGTDGVMGRPGACHPGRRLTRNVRNGLTAVRAAQLTRRSVWEALHARACYATSGARILLDVEVNGCGMGGECIGPTVDLCVNAEGTAALERIDVLCDTDVVHSWEIAALDRARLRVLWGGAEAEGTAGAQRVRWDGVLRADNGRLTDVVPVGLQSPLDSIRPQDERSVQWCSATGGNEMGFSFRPDGVDRLCLETPQGMIEIDVEAALRKEQYIALGGASKRVRIGAAPRVDGTRSAQRSWRGETPRQDAHAYWVRVIQVDGQRAWSSPIYAARAL